MLSWFVNKKGIISIYALTILSIVSVFITYITVLIQTQYVQKDLSYIDVYVIHHVKKTIEKQDEDIEPFEEIKHWREYELKFHYEKNLVDVVAVSKKHMFHMQIQHDKKRIIDYTYLDDE